MLTTGVVKRKRRKWSKAAISVQPKAVSLNQNPISWRLRREATESEAAQTSPPGPLS